MNSMIVKFWIFLAGLVLVACGTAKCRAQQPFAISNVTQRPFVTGVTPVIGPNGFVGGVFVDRDGVIRRPAVDELGELHRKWRDAQMQQAKDLVIVDTGIIVFRTGGDIAVLQRRQNQANRRFRAGILRQRGFL